MAKKGEREHMVCTYGKVRTVRKARTSRGAIAAATANRPAEG